MCGIAGFLAPGGLSKDAGHFARRMVDALVHRGPDDSGTWLDEDAGVALGHRRLSIIDLSPNASQPMISQSGRWVIVFNGEIYNFEVLRDQLVACGYRFRSTSDTEVLLAAVETWGPEKALKRSVGMFALALWDRNERVLRLARDRIGEKPLFYGWAGRTFLFGSELKALRSFPGWQPSLDRNALALFFRHNYIPTPYSIYTGISKLTPGTILTVGPGTTESDPQAYWSLRETVVNGLADRFSGTENDAVERLDELLRTSIRGQMVSDVPLGAFLSGGIDSSTVVALMQAQSQQPVRTFTIGFKEQAYDEALHARAIAGHLGTAHTELYASPEDAISVIPKLPTLYDEPFSDASQIPTYLVSKLARCSVTVSLSGDGGDELFGGYNRYFLGRTIWQRTGWLPRPLRELAAFAVTRLSPQSWDRLFGNLGRLLPVMLRPRHVGEGIHKLAGILRSPGPEGMYRRLVSHWENPTEIVTGSEEPPTVLSESAGWPADYTERMMYLDMATYLADDILVKLDRASMGVSLESRVPLLDHRIVEFAWSLPLSMKIRNGKGKWLLRRVLARYVPEALVERPKMGFGIPIDAWLRGPLRDWAEGLLDEHTLADTGYLEPGPIRQKWEEHLSGRRNWQYLLWDVLMFQAWLAGDRDVVRFSPNRVASTG